MQLIKKDEHLKLKDNELKRSNNLLKQKGELVVNRDKKLKQFEVQMMQKDDQLKLLKEQLELQQRDHEKQLASALQEVSSKDQELKKVERQCASLAILQKQIDQRVKSEMLHKYMSVASIRAGYTQHDITLAGFERFNLEGKNNYWYSKQFYTHKNGYCSDLNIRINNSVSEPYISIFLRPKIGDFDKQLHWPAHCSLYFEIVNQSGNYGHFGITSTIDWDQPLVQNSTHIRIIDHFLYVKELHYNSSCFTQYLKEGNLFFRLFVKFD